MSLRVALVTCSELPDLDPDDQPLIGQFAQAGIEATPVIWSDPAVNWQSFDRVLVRNTWDYTDHLAQFLSWVESVGSSVRNPLDLMVWSTDKIYLLDLLNAGIPVIDTQFVDHAKDTWVIPPTVDFVVKPTISAGSRDTLRLESAAAMSVAKAQDLIDFIVATGKQAMVQPYLDRVDSDGETALLYIGGKYSHAIRKGPLLQKNIELERVHGLYVQEDISARTPRCDQRDLADRLLAYVSQRFGVPLYVRIDLIDNHVGEPTVLEVEAVEPSMFFGTEPASYDRFVQASLL